MVGINKLTVRFINATDYLKDTKGLKHKDICNLIGLKRWQYDQIRIGRRVPSEKEVRILVENHKDIARFFEEDSDDFGDGGDNNNELVKSLREVIAAKDQLLKMKDEKIKDLEIKLEFTHRAHAETLNKLYSEEELLEELIKREKELKKLRGEE